MTLAEPKENSMAFKDGDSTMEMLRTMENMVLLKTMGAGASILETTIKTLTMNGSMEPSIKMGAGDLILETMGNTTLEVLPCQVLVVQDQTSITTMVDIAVEVQDLAVEVQDLAVEVQDLTVQILDLTGEVQDLAMEVQDPIIPIMEIMDNRAKAKEVGLIIIRFFKEAVLVKYKK